TDTAFTVAISGSATEHVDYHVEPSGVIPAGSLSADLTLEVFDDRLVELDETVTLQLDTSDFATIKLASASTEVVLDDWRGTVLIGTTAADEGRAIDVDSDGGIYVAGETRAILYGPTPPDWPVGYSVMPF